MAWLNMEFRSKALNMPVEIDVLKSDVYDNNAKCKVLILLHDVNGDRMEWLLKSQIADMLGKYNMLVVMPSGKNSFYINTFNGYKYMDYISVEIIDFIKSNFYVSEDRKDYIIAGCGMGGYGALRCGINNIKQFGNIGSFSGLLDVNNDNIWPENIKKENIFDEKRLAENNIYEIFGTADTTEKTNIYLCCGKNDKYYGCNIEFYELIKDKENFSVSWKSDEKADEKSDEKADEKAAEGGHDYSYFNKNLLDMLEMYCGEV